jgi:ABC-type multidrug transport system fused ATPase/permease subunit
MKKRKLRDDFENKDKIFIKCILKSLKLLYGLASKYFIIAAIMTLVLGMSSALTIYATKLLINVLQFGVSDPKKFLIMLAFYGGINVGVSVIHNFQSYISEKHHLYVNNQLDVMCLEKCKRLNLKDFEDEHIYDIVNRATGMGRTKIYELYINILSLVQSIVAVLAIYAVIININRVLFLFILAVPIISTGANIFIGRKQYDLLKKRTSRNRKLSYINYLLTNNIAIKEILSYECHNYLISKFKKINEDILDENNKFLKLRTVINFILSFFEELVSISIIICVVLMARAGNMLIGDMVAYINSLSTITENLKNLLLCISSIYNNKLYIEDFFVFLDLEENIETERLKIQKIKKIEFDNVSFSYKDTDKEILKNISLKIDCSKPIAIIGENGSGKTTIIKLLAGLYRTYKGDIRINGIELKMLSSESYKKKIGIVFQDFNKYELSIRENIALADTEKINSDNEIYQILKVVGLDKEFGNNLDVQMGNWFGGRELSKGQWQRIAIARALIRDSDVLVLDEPTAALDPIIEREIFQLIKNISKQKILIFITHRVSNLLELDPYIFIMENGQIVSSGNQEQLKDDIHFNMLLTGNNKE